MLFTYLYSYLYITYLHIITSASVTPAPSAVIKSTATGKNDPACTLSKVIACAATGTPSLTAVITAVAFTAPTALPASTIVIISPGL